MGFEIDSPGKKYEITPAGTYAGRMIQLVDLGYHENVFTPGKYQRKIRLTFELNENMEDGKPFVISGEYTLSLHEDSNFRHLLESWRGRAFDDSELVNVDIIKLLGVTGLVSVIHAKSKQGKDFAKISSVAKLPKGMEAPAAQNKMYSFDTTAPEMDLYDTFPDWLKKKINLRHPLTLAGSQPPTPQEEDAPF